NPGVHNVLEPAVFGIPIVIGKNYSHFAEATQLVNLKGVISIKNQQELNQILDKLLSEEDYRKEKGKICAEFIMSQKGATQRIMYFLNEKSDFKYNYFNISSPATERKDSCCSGVYFYCSGTIVGVFL